MTFHKDDKNKPRFELVPPNALEDVARVLTYGAAKYTRPDENGVMQDGANNWHKAGLAGVPRYIGAALRHIMAALRGEDTDTETGLPHLAHATCCLLFAAELRARETSTATRRETNAMAQFAQRARDLPAIEATAPLIDEHGRGVVDADACARCLGQGEVKAYDDDGGTFHKPCPRCDGTGRRGGNP